MGVWVERKVRGIEEAEGKWVFGCNFYKFHFLTKEKNYSIINMYS